jgi:hypothetical protein
MQTAAKARSPPISLYFEAFFVGRRSLHLAAPDEHCRYLCCCAGLEVACMACMAAMGLCRQGWEHYLPPLLVRILNPRRDWRGSESSPIGSGGRQRGIDGRIPRFILLGSSSK